MQCRFLTARLYNEKVCGLQLQLLFVHIDLSEEMSSNMNLNSLKVEFSIWKAVYEQAYINSKPEKAEEETEQAVHNTIVSHVAFKPLSYLQEKQSIHSPLTSLVPFP